MVVFKTPYRKQYDLHFNHIIKIQDLQVLVLNALVDNKLNVCTNKRDEAISDLWVFAKGVYQVHDKAVG